MEVYSTAGVELFPKGMAAEVLPPTELATTYNLKQSSFTCTCSFVLQIMMSHDVVQEVQAMHGLAKALLSELEQEHADP